MRAMIVKLTPSQRIALVAGMTGHCWQWINPRQRRMGIDLIDSGLLDNIDRSHTTIAGRMALRANPSSLTWRPTDPIVDTAHTVRKLLPCAICDRLCTDPPKVGDERGHMTCFVLRDGWAALAEAEPFEIDKMRLDDLNHLGITMAHLEAMANDRAIFATGRWP